MASVQERLQISRIPLDKWSVREQLCLASAVSCSGDQNWMSVSRTLKLICGNGSSNRPADWFSQKNCAVQYGHLLENVETPKRKKRTSEGTNLALTTIETPTSDDLILRRLTDERIQELRTNIRTGQEEYAHVLRELKLLQWGNLSDDQIIEMWREIEKEQEAQRIEEMKLENQMREREQRKVELQRNWRPISAVSDIVKPDTTSANTNTNTVDMDVEEIVTSNRPMIGNLNIITTQQQNIQTAIEPSASLPPRSAAPTITTLLTSGTIPISNQPVITLTSFIPPNEAEQLLSRPISGLPTDSTPKPVTSTQTLISPSRSAPTLSMLLERSKPTVASAKTADSSISEIKTIAKEDKPETKVYRSDSINEEVPMDIEEDVAQTNMAVANTSQSADLDEPDPNEEQQLLEVFKNIGNIDDIDVDIDVSDVIDDETVDFLKEVTEEAAAEITSGLEEEEKFDSCETKEEINEVKIETEQVNKENLLEQNNRVEETAESDEKDSGEKVKVETSSDDSTDDIPLAAVASLESKERNSFLEVSQEAASPKETESVAQKVDDIEGSNDLATTDDAKMPSLESTSRADIRDTDNVVEDLKEDKTSVDEDPTTPLSTSLAVESNSTEQPDESITEQKETEVVENRKEGQTEDFDDATIDTSEENQESTEAKITEEIITDTAVLETVEEPCTSEEQKSTPPPIIAVSSYGDTDEDSSATDVSGSTRRDDRSSTTSREKTITTRPRKQHIDTNRDEAKGGDDEFATVSATPVRPALLRKLRERDRSESPMIEEESNTSDQTSSLRGRQRCSSTPVIDSIPNSPASSERDDREAKASKKSLLSIYNALQPNRYASLFQSVFSDDQNVKYVKACLRPIDFQLIKKNIESGNIKSVSELQRDVLLMCQNALMISRRGSSNYKAIYAYSLEVQNIKGFICNPYGGKADKDSRDREREREHKISGNPNIKVRARKSQRNL